MATIEEDLLQDALDDQATVAYIRQHLPSEVQDRLTDEDLYYCIDVIGEYYVDLLEKNPGDGDIDLDFEDVAAYVVKQARRDKMGPYSEEDIYWVARFEYESADEEEGD